MLEAAYDGRYTLPTPIGEAKAETNPIFPASTPESAPAGVTSPGERDTAGIGPIGGGGHPRAAATLVMVVLVHRFTVPSSLRLQMSMSEVQVERKVGSKGTR